MTNRVFTDEELEKMGKRTLDLLTEAIEAGDKEQAKNLANRMCSEFQWMHDFYLVSYISWEDYIYRNYGDDALYQAIKEVEKKFALTAQDAMVDVRKVDFRLLVEGVMSRIRGHLQPAKVEEDDEKVCITMHPCGSGERAIQKGCYGPPCNISRIQKPSPMTRGRTDFPIYCIHEANAEILTIEHFGYPIVVTVPPEKVGGGEPCKLYMYKNPKDIPEAAYARVGKQKPTNL